MKRIKRILLAALAAAALLTPAIASSPQPVQAGGLCELGIFSAFCGEDAPPIPDPPIAVPQSCRITNVYVSGTVDQMTYKYDLRCTINGSNIPTLQVTGTNNNYDTAIAHEELTYQAFHVAADWVCPDDPWASFDPLPCSQVPGSLVVSGHNTSEFDFSEQTMPFSTQYLGPDQHHVLDAQRINALNQPPAPAPLQVIGRATTVNNAAISSALGTTPASAPAPTLPDLQVPTVGGDKQLSQGLTSVYSIGVSNMGAKPSTQVQVAIQVTGAVEYVGLDQTPAGWDCSGSSPILCAGPLGGSGDPVQNLVVSFQLRVRGAKAGTGAITVTADPNGLIQESNETNNNNQLIVTVK